jgi:hypothetical protein
MAMDGGCYCGEVRYSADGDAMFKAQCHCRECQTFSGGGPNYFMVMPKDGFTYTKGKPRQFTRGDIYNPVTREFCPNCGTHLVTLRPGQDVAILKVGTLDDPTIYGGPKAAIYTMDLQPFHVIPDGLPQFEGLPTRR